MKKSDRGVEQQSTAAARKATPKPGRNKPHKAQHWTKVGVTTQCFEFRAPFMVRRLPTATGSRSHATAPSRKLVLPAPFLLRASGSGNPELVPTHLPQDRQDHRPKQGRRQKHQLSSASELRGAGQGRSPQGVAPNVYLRAWCDRPHGPHQRPPDNNMEWVCLEGKLSLPQQ